MGMESTEYAGQQIPLSEYSENHLEFDGKDLSYCSKSSDIVHNFTGSESQ